MTLIQNLKMVSGLCDMVNNVKLLEDIENYCKNEHSC